MSSIVYAPGITSLPVKFENGIKKALDSVNIPSITVSSTYRTPERQAKAMYDNLQSLGVASQRNLYGPAGDRVIDTYELKKKYGYGEADTLAAMANTIRYVGASNVSAHATNNPESFVALDIVPDSIPKEKRPLFVSVMKAISSKLLDPSVSKGDPVYHMELKASNFFFDFIVPAGFLAAAIYYINHKKETAEWLRKIMRKRTM